MPLNPQELGDEGDYIENRLLEIDAERPVLLARLAEIQGAGCESSNRAIGGRLLRRFERSWSKLSERVPGAS